MPASTGAVHPGDAAGKRLFRDIIFAGLPPRGRDWALMAFAGLLATAMKGYNYGFIDQAILLPYVKRCSNPALYPNDLLLDSMRTMQPIFWRMIGAAGSVIPVELLVLLLHILTHVLTLIAVWALAVNLFRNRTSANIGLLLGALSVPMAYTLGLDPPHLVWPELVQRSFVFPWLLLALVFALHRRLLSAMVLVGLAVNIHPMSAGVVGMMIFGGALLDPRARRKLPLAAVAAVVCAAPMFIGITLRPGAAGGASALKEQWFELLRLRMGHHIFPGTWYLSRWLGALLVLAVGLRALLSVDLRERRHRTAMAWFVVPLLLWAPGYIFTEVRPVPLIALAQLFRGTKFAMLIALLYFGHHQVLRMSTGRWGQIAVAWVSLAMTPALWAVGLVAAVPSAVAHLLASGPGKDVIPTSGRAHTLAIAGLLIVMAAGGAMAIRQRAQQGWTNWWGGVSPEWYNVQVWVKDNTPLDTMVLVPPVEKGFRIFSERPIVGTLKDGGPHENDAENMIEWWRRMQDLGCEAVDDGRSIHCNDFRRFGADEIMRLRRRYDADLLVTYSDHDLPWTPLYQNEQWVVYGFGGGVGREVREGAACTPDE